MSIRLMLVLLLVTLSVIICGAQPANSLTWLRVEVRRADDTLCTSSTFSHALYLVVGEETKTRMNEGRLIGNDPGTLIISELNPGTHEMSLQLSEFGITDGPRTIEISKGANVYIWKLPPLFPIDGELLLEGKPKAIPLELQCQVMAQAGNRRTFLTPIANTPKGYHLAGLMVGKYSALVYCDQGYAITEYDIPLDGKMEPLKPLALLPGGRVQLQVVDKDDKPILALATLALRRIIAPRFTPVISVTTDKKGAASVMLPPGEWRWTTSLVGYTPTVGTVNVVGGVDTELRLKLVKLPT